jgi:hypothetical protein
VPPKLGRLISKTENYTNECFVFEFFLGGGGGWCECFYILKNEVMWKEEELGGFI